MWVVQHVPSQRQNIELITVLLELSYDHRRLQLGCPCSQALVRPCNPHRLRTRRRIAIGSLKAPRRFRNFPRALLRASLVRLHHGRGLHGRYVHVGLKSPFYRTVTHPRWKRTHHGLYRMHTSRCTGAASASRPSAANTTWSGTGERTRGKRRMVSRVPPFRRCEMLSACCVENARGAGRCSRAAMGVDATSNCSRDARLPITPRRRANRGEKSRWLP